MNISESSPNFPKNGSRQQIRRVKKIEYVEKKMLVWVTISIVLSNYLFILFPVILGCLPRYDGVVFAWSIFKRFVKWQNLTKIQFPENMIDFLPQEYEDENALEKGMNWFWLCKMRKYLFL